jgi:ubiquinone/menaquinone biosynthesis C-methylase UbiE
MAYDFIRPSGGDTGTPVNLEKRLALIQKYVQVQDKKIIDCGCGTGQYVLGLLNCSADAYGVEYEGEKVCQFKKDHPQFAERVSQGDIEQVDFENGSFNLALLNEVLEHVPNEMKALQEIHRILKPNGKVIVFSPNRFYPFEIHSVRLKNSDVKLPIYFPFIPYIPLNLGHRMFDYVARNYWPGQLRQLIKKAGFRIVHVDYVWQTLENISGTQPGIVAPFRLILRKIFAIMEKIPVIRIFGVSQVIIAQKVNVD